MGSLDVLRLLLRGGADPDGPNADGTTPLVVACRTREMPLRLEIARELLGAGADPTLESDYKSVPLHLDLLLSKAPATLNHVAKDGMTPLCAASMCGQDRATSRLLSAGASNAALFEVEIEGGSGEWHPCPLEVAVCNAHRNVVSALLLYERGLEAVGGAEAIPRCLIHAVDNKQPGILQSCSAQREMGGGSTGRRAAFYSSTRR